MEGSVYERYERYSGAAEPEGIGGKFVPPPPTFFILAVIVPFFWNKNRHFKWNRSALVSETIDQMTFFLGTVNACEVA